MPKYYCPVCGNQAVINSSALTCLGAYNKNGTPMYPTIRRIYLGERPFEFTSDVPRKYAMDYIRRVRKNLRRSPKNIRLARCNNA